MKLKSSLRIFYGRHYISCVTSVTVVGCLCRRWPWMRFVCRMEVLILYFSVYVLCELLFVFSVLFYYNCVVCPLIYDFWLSLCCLSFDLRLLIIIGLSVLWFTTSDYHWVVCPLIYDFWLSLLTTQW
jgi:hypothetical protein